MPYQVPQHIADNKIFLTNFSEVQGGRLDPVYVYSIKHKRTYNYASKSLNKLVSFATGGTPSKANPEYWDGNIFWVSAKDFKSFYIDSSEDTITGLGLRKSSSKLIPQNSLLMVVRSGILLHTLPIAITKCPVAINQDIKALFVKDSQLNAQYLGYFFDVFNKYVLSKIVKLSTTVQSVNTNELERLEIPLPSSEIQKEIVSHMDAAYAQKQQKEQQAASLLQSIDDYLLGELGIQLPETKSQTIQDRMFVVNFSEVNSDRFDPLYNKSFSYIKKLRSIFTWFTLNDLVLNNGQYGASESAIDYNLGDVRYIRITDIDEYGNLKSTDKKSAAKIDSTYLLQYNDVLFARSGSVGRCYIHKDLSEQAIYAGYLIRYDLNKEKIIPDYLFYYCNSAVYRLWVATIQRPAVQANINAQEYRKLPIPLPPLQKQQEIVDHISSIRQQAKALQEEGRNILEQAKKEVELMILG